MNKDIESLVGEIVLSVHMNDNSVHLDAVSSDEEDSTTMIEEPDMVIDSITGDLFKMIGRTVGSIERRESVKAFEGAPAIRFVSYSIYLEYVGLVVIQFKEPSNDD